MKCVVTGHVLWHYGYGRLPYVIGVERFLQYRKSLQEERFCFPIVSFHSIQFRLQRVRELQGNNNSQPSRLNANRDQSLLPIGACSVEILYRSHFVSLGDPTVAAGIVKANQIITAGSNMCVLLSKPLFGLFQRLHQVLFGFVKSALQNIEAQTSSLRGKEFHSSQKLTDPHSELDKIRLLTSTSSTQTLSIIDNEASQNPKNQNKTKHRQTLLF